MDRRTEVPGSSEAHYASVTKRAPNLLDAWREAERRYDELDPADDGYQAARLDVVRAWIAYQEVVTEDHGQVVVVTDDARRYVAATDNVEKLLGYSAADLIGISVDDLAAPESSLSVDAAWAGFIDAGRDCDTFTLLARDGSRVPVTYEARADTPLPGFHVSRLRLIREPVRAA